MRNNKLGRWRVWRSLEHARPVVGLALAIGVVASHADAQSATGGETQARQRELDVLRAERPRIRDAIDRVLSEEAPEEEAITFQQVLANPDDPELNLRFARAEARRGDLQSASATLERLLRLDPELHAVRLFYAIVLFRLDMADEAEREFQRLLTVGLPESDVTIVEEYLRQISIGQQRVRGSATMTMGMHYDSNRDFIPQTGTFLFLDSESTDIQEPNADLGYLAATSFEMSYDPGFQAGHVILGSLDMVRDNQIEEDDLDVLAFKAEIGATYKASFGDLTIGLSPSLVYLGDEAYVANYGSRFRATRPLSEALFGHVEVYASYEDYNDISTNTDGADQTGWKSGVRTGLRYQVMRTLWIDTEYVYTRKAAKRRESTGRPNEYNAHAMTATATQLLPWDAFAILSFHYDYRFYETPDTFFSSDQRRDHIKIGRATLGIPLGNIPGLSRIPRILKDITLTGTVEFSHQDSTILNYDYKNWRGQTLLSKRFLF